MNTIAEEAASTAPPNTITIQGNTTNRTQNTRHEPHNYTITDGGTDGGVSLYEPHGYWVNMSLSSFRALVAFLNAHLKHRSERFKPIGWRLVPIEAGNETIEVREGQSVTFIGDAFVIRNPEGEAIGPAYNAMEYSVEPIVS